MSKFFVIVGRMLSKEFPSLDAAIDGAFQMATDWLKDRDDFYKIIPADVKKNYSVSLYSYDDVLDGLEADELKKRSYNKDSLLKAFNEDETGTLAVSAILYFYETCKDCALVQIIDEAKTNHWLATDQSVKEMGQILDSLGGGTARFGNGVELTVKKAKNASARPIMPESDKWNFAE